MEADFREMELLIYTWWTEDWSVSGRPLQQDLNQDDTILEGNTEEALVRLATGWARTAKYNRAKMTEVSLQMSGKMMLPITK